MAEKKSVRTRARMLDAAAKILAERGYAETRLEDIADEAGTKAGSLYYYFDSREQLVMEVLTVAMTRVTAAVKQSVRKLPKDASYREKITAALRANLEMVLEHDAYTAASLRSAPNLPLILRRQQLALQRDLGSFWRKLLQSAKANGEINPRFNLSVLRMLLMGAMNWSIEWYRRSGALAPAEIADQLAAMVFEGVHDSAAGWQRSPKATAKRVAPVSLRS